MATVFLAPVANDTPFYKAGQPLLGGKLYTFSAGTTTPLITYTDATGLTANANPIILNADGYPAAAGNRVQVWLLSSNTYKFVLQDAASVTQWTLDNLTGINDVSLSATEWVAVVPANASLAHIDTTNFAVGKDQRNEAVVERWVRVTVGGGIAYGIITDAQYNSGTDVTTITIIPSGTVALDSGISRVEWGLLRPDHTSVPLDVSNITASPAIASAGTIDVWGINGNLVHVTGTTTITGMGTAPHAGARRRLIFDSSLTIAHNSSTLVCPGGTNLAVVANDVLDVTADTTAKLRLGLLTTGLPVGTVIDYAGSGVPTGWLECDGSAVSRTTYSSLFAAIASNYGVGDGSTTFNIPDFRGRARIGHGTGTFVSRFTNADVSTGGDTIAVPVNTTLYTGTAVVYNAASAAAPLVDTTTYYVIRLSSTSVSLATTLANAVAGTAINITTTGTGAQTLTWTLTGRFLGQVGGEETHALTSAEMAPHKHTIQTSLNAAGGAVISRTGSGAPDSTQDTDNSTGSTAHNVMSPFSVTLALIKF